MSDRPALIGFGAGVMLSATCFSLVIPAVRTATEITHSRLGGALVTAAGIVAGGLALWLGNRYSPHEHFIKGPEGIPAARLRRLWLFVIAITIHNVPEGMTVGVGFGGGDFALEATLG